MRDGTDAAEEIDVRSLAVQNAPAAIKVRKRIGDPAMDAVGGGKHVEGYD